MNDPTPADLVGLKDDEIIEQQQAEIERLRALITELINAAADGGVMYQGITQRWWDAKEALRKAVGR